MTLLPGADFRAQTAPIFTSESVEPILRRALTLL
jgi:hypothetical protein